MSLIEVLKSCYAHWLTLQHALLAPEPRMMAARQTSSIPVTTARWCGVHAATPSTFRCVSSQTCFKMLGTSCQLV